MKGWLTPWVLVVPCTLLGSCGSDGSGSTASGGSAGVSASANGGNSGVPGSGTTSGGTAGFGGSGTFAGSGGSLTAGGTAGTGTGAAAGRGGDGGKDASVEGGAGPGNSRDASSGDLDAATEGGVQPGPSADVLTERFGNARTGNVVDAAITPSLVASGRWQRLGTFPVEGAVWAQPLYVHGLTVPGGTTHNVVYIATAENKIYAYDADTYEELWSHVVLEGPDTSDSAFVSGCTLLSPLNKTNQLGIGIQSTPVIDRDAGYLYAVYRTGGSNPLSATQRIARVALTTGEVKTAAIGLTFPPNDGWSGVRQRASLLLLDRVIYAAFSSHCEERSEPGSNGVAADDYTYQYRGAVVAISQGSLATVGQLDMLPSGAFGGGIWMGSSGLAADGKNIYFSTGNQLDTSNAPAGGANLSSSFVRLTPMASPASGTVTSVDFTQVPTDYFTPWRATWQNQIDLDLGAAGVLLPPGTGEVVGGGKEGIVYVLDRTNLGKLSTHAFDPTPASCFKPNANAGCDTTTPSCYTAAPDSADDESTRVVQKFVATANMDCATPPMSNWAPWSHLHGIPVYGTVGSRGAAQDYLYLFIEKGQLEAIPRLGSTKPLKFADASHWVRANATTPSGGMPGGMLTLSTDGAGHGVVFAALPLESSSTSFGLMKGALLAFDATPRPDGTLAQLWGDYQQDYIHAKFVPPTVADGKVFLATFSGQVAAYGYRADFQPRATAATVLSTFRDPSSGSVTAAMVQPDGDIVVLGAAGTDATWTRLAALGKPRDFSPDAEVVLTRDGEALVLFAVGSDGKLRSYRAASLNMPAVWTGPVTAAGIASLPSGAPLATAHRGASNEEMDVFVVDVEGNLESMASTSSGPWSAQKLTTNGPFVRGSPAGLAADVQAGAAPTVDVFGVDATGTLQVYRSTQSAAGGAWKATAVAGAGLPPGARLVTGHQVFGATNILNVFGIAGALGEGKSVDPDSVSGNTFNTGGGRHTGALAVVSASGQGAFTAQAVKRHSSAPGVPGGHVAALNQGVNQLDVFFVGQNGAVQVYGVAGVGTAWTYLEVKLRAVPGAPLAPTARTLLAGAPDQIDVLVPDTDHLYGARLTSGFWGSATVAY
jgi:hypothetical protein